MNNCIPGDKAVIVGGTVPENLHAIVSVLREYTPGEILPLHEQAYTVLPRHGTVWVVESFGRALGCRLTDGTMITTPIRAMQDRILRPLRDTDGEDEMVTIAGKAPFAEARELASNTLEFERARQLEKAR